MAWKPVPFPPSYLTVAVLPAGLYEEICLLPSPLSDRRAGGLSTLHAESERNPGNPG